MNRTRTLAIILLLVASTGFIFGSFGFTSVSAERDVSVQVVNDEQAYVGYQSSDLTVRDGKTVDLVTVENRFTDVISVIDVTIEDGPFTITTPTIPSNISPGKSRTIRGTVDCSPAKTQEIEVTVTLNGSGITAQIFGDTETRDFTLTCAPKTEETPPGTLDGATFDGAGKFAVNTTNVGTTKLVYWTADKKWTKKGIEFSNQSLSSFDTNQKLQPSLNGRTRIVAVYFPEYDVTFVHPNYYNGNWGAGDGIRVSGKHHPSDGNP